MYDYTDNMQQIDTSDILGQISELAEHQREYQDIVDNLEKQLKVAKARLTSISEYELPALLDQVGISELTTANGAHVKVKETIRVSLSKERQNPAMDWLVQNGHGGMIKSEVTAKYDRGQESIALSLRDMLEDALGEDHVSMGRKVEPSTLRAFVKRQLESGTDMPLDLFGVYRQRVTEVKS